MSGGELRKSALHAAHAALGAKLGEEDGWQVPLHYGGVLDEAAAVRRRAGVFDVSHVGRIRLRGGGAPELLERLCTCDVAGQDDDTAARTLLLNEQGCILADGFLVRAETFWLLTCNACNRAKVLEHLGAHAGEFDVKFDDQTERTVMLAVAGPAAAGLLDAVLPTKPSGMPRGAVRVGSLMIARYVAMRTGCTNVWSLEVVLPNMLASQAWRFITAGAGANCVAPAGVGARDVLRIEAGLPRYGHEINETIDPIAAGLEQAVDFEHDFIGRDAVARIRRAGPARRLVGLVLTGPRDEPDARGIPKLGAPVSRADGAEVGTVTSGTYSPTLEQVIAMAYVATDAAAVGTELRVETDAGGAPARVADLPFCPGGA